MSQELSVELLEHLVCCSDGTTDFEFLITNDGELLITNNDIPIKI